MDSSIFKDKYLNLGIEEKTFKYILNLKENVKKLKVNLLSYGIIADFIIKNIKNFFRILLSK